MGRLAVVLAAVLASVVGCSKPDEPTPRKSGESVDWESVPGHDRVAQDTTLKEGPRLVPPEAYLRTYLRIFGGLAPLEAEAQLRGADGSSVFDTWNDYVSSLGIPDYRIDVPRGSQTNTLMLATFERLGIALCDRAIEKDMQGAPPPVGARLIFDFDVPLTLTLAEFGPRFDVLHRTFLGYPAALGPAKRASNFFDLYQKTSLEHALPDAGKSRFTAAEAGWAAVCYGLVRHPEFQLY